MISKVETHLPKVHRLCREHFVEELYLFGSAAKGEYVEGESDLDFVVTFTNELPVEDFAGNYFSLLESLQSIFNCPVDLLSYKVLRNQVIKDEVESSKIQLYAA